MDVTIYAAIISAATPIVKEAAEKALLALEKKESGESVQDVTISGRQVASDEITPELLSKLIESLESVPPSPSPLSQIGQAIQGRAYQLRPEDESIQKAQLPEITAYALAINSDEVFRGARKRIDLSNFLMNLRLLHPLPNS